MKDLKGTIVKAFYKSEFWLKKSAPDICVGCGVIGITVATVMACKATKKADDILDEREEHLNSVEESTFIEDSDEYDAEVKTTNIIAVKKLVKVYAPSVVLWTLSMGCIVESHNLLKKRNIALAASYSTLDGMYKFYRKNVCERFGDDVDEELRSGIKHVETEETKTGKDGKEKVTKKKETISELDETNSYSKFFGPESREWQSNNDFNIFFLRQEQNHFNDLLKAKGFLFLNDVYKELDIPETLAGQCAGWVYDKNNPDTDSYVDFGIFGKDGKISNANVRFVNGYEDVILLNFNVDGNILDKFYKFGRR